jgi:hypothetical protein
MAYYKVGTHINFKRQARIEQLRNDIGAAVFYLLAAGMFLYCMYS